MLQRTARLARYIVALALIFALGTLTVGAQGNDQTITSPSGAFSLTLPATYVVQVTTIPNFGDVLAFGDSQQTLNNIIGVNSGAQTSLAIHGTGGFVGQVDPQLINGQAPDPFVTPMMGAMSQLLLTMGAQTLQEAAAHRFGDRYNGMLAVTDHGLIGVLHDGKALLVGMVLSDDPTMSPAALTDILDKLLIGADVGAAGPVQPVNPDVISPSTPEATPGAPAIWRSSDQRVSLDLPADWTVLDHIADADTMAYGDSLEAARSRLASARPDLADKTPITGSGGLVILYRAANLNVNPQSPDLGPLMTQALAQLKTQGYVADAPMALESVPGGLYAYIKGTEVGYLALIPFGDQVAYVTGTGTLDTFPNAEDTLVAILESVRSPAVAETPAIGGLGGLEAATTVPPGLGGLGSPNATPEASS